MIHRRLELRPFPDDGQGRYTDIPARVYTAIERMRPNWPRGDGHAQARQVRDVGRHWRDSLPFRSSTRESIR